MSRAATWAAGQSQPTSGTRSPGRGAAKVSNASVTGAKATSARSCRATHVWPPGPFQMAGLIGVRLLRARHVRPPVRRTQRAHRALPEAHPAL